MPVKYIEIRCQSGIYWTNHKMKIPTRRRTLNGSDCKSAIFEISIRSAEHTMYRTCTKFPFISAWTVVSLIYGSKLLMTVLLQFIGCNEFVQNISFCVMWMMERAHELMTSTHQTKWFSWHRLARAQLRLSCGECSLRNDRTIWQWRRIL